MEGLVDHPHFLPYTVNIRSGIAYVHFIDKYSAAVRLCESVETGEEDAFSGSGRADHSHTLAAPDLH